MKNVTWTLERITFNLECLLNIVEPQNYVISFTVTQWSMTVPEIYSLKSSFSSQLKKSRLSLPVVRMAGRLSIGGVIFKLWLSSSLPKVLLLKWEETKEKRVHTLSDSASSATLRYKILGIWLPEKIMHKTKDGIP